MKAHQITKHTELQDLGATFRADVPEPVPKKDEVLVDIYSAGLNFFDILMAAGM